MLLNVFALLLPKTHFLDGSLLLYYCKSLIKLLKGHSKLVSEAYHSILSLDEDQMPHELQPGDYLC